MKKTIALVLALVCILSWFIWGQGETYTIHVTVPAGTTGEFVYIEDFIYSDEEISPQKNRLELKAINIPDRTEFVLKPIEAEEENAYERTYLDRGEPVLIDVEKGAWFKIGIALQNPTDEDIEVGITVESVKVTFSVEARAAFFGWVREQVDSFYHYFFEGENVTDEPEGYELSWIPEDCVFVTSYEIPGGKSYIYTDEKDSLICFSYQSGTESGHLFVDSVKAERIEVEVNGCPAEIARYKDDAETDHIIWTDSTNKILFYITGHFDQETFIKMAESVTETSNLEE